MMVTMIVVIIVIMIMVYEKYVSMVTVGMILDMITVNCGGVNQYDCGR